MINLKHWYFTEYDRPCEIDFDNINEYGYSPQNPIKTRSVYEEYSYLNRLRYKGRRVYYERIGYIKGFYGIIIDKFLIRIKIKPAFTNRKQAIQDFIIYINAHSNYSDGCAPKYFMLEDK